MTALPAIVLNARLDLLAANRLAVALYSPAYDDPSRPVNLARFCFLNPHATALYPHWDDAANTTVAMLRIEAGRNPYDRDLSDLIGELSTRSETFRNRWAAHNVVLHRAGAKQFHHPVVGDLSLAYEVMELSADTGLTLTAYSPEPDSPSAGRTGPARQLGRDTGSEPPTGDDPPGRSTRSLAVHDKPSARPFTF